MEKKAFTAIVSGIVQGVSFRYHTRKVALRLGLTGTVQNLVTGDVKVLAEGDETALLELAKWLERGPSFAEVERVALTRQPFTGRFPSFDIIG